MNHLESNIKAREDEISVYKLDIAVFQHMISAIADGDELQGYRDGELTQRLHASRLELRKVELVLAALQAQS